VGGSCGLLRRWCGLFCHNLDWDCEMYGRERNCGVPVQRYDN
jgi:hypothetical protein